MKLNSILFPTDFSESSDAALGYASALAAENGATLYIVHVADDSPAYFAGYAGFSFVPDVPATLEREMRSMLDDVKPSRAGVNLQRRYLRGAAVSEIVAFADREKVDLIVMGTHGRTGISRVLMGSIAEGVLRKATCPVLTVKTPMELEEDEEVKEEPGQKQELHPRTKFSLH
ncbi:universal stress protein [Pirellulales bacterium]|nr:universal stress protein [Pirellulales bacterium]